MNTQPYALKVADLLDDELRRNDKLTLLYTHAAAELRRLHEENETLRARLAQPEQEPVAWADKYDIERAGHDFYVSRQQPAKGGVPLYTAPPQREWQGLTDEEILEEYRQSYGADGNLTDVYFARAIEAKLKEKNNG